MVRALQNPKNKAWSMPETEESLMRTWIMSFLMVFSISVFGEFFSSPASLTAAAMTAGSTITENPNNQLAAQIARVASECGIPASQLALGTPSSSPRPSLPRTGEVGTHGTY